MSHLPDLEDILERFWGKDPILMGYINVDLDDACNLRSQLISDMMTKFGLIDLMHHFWQRRHLHHLNIWTQV